MPPNLYAKVPRCEHDPASCIGNRHLDQPLDGIEAKKGIGAERDGPPVALIGGTEPHDHLSLCLSHPLRSLLG